MSRQKDDEAKHVAEILSPLQACPGRRAQAILQEALARGYLTLPAGYNGRKVDHVWMNWCSKNRHPEVVICHKRTRAVVWLALHGDRYSRNPGIRLTDTGMDLIRPVALGAEVRRDCVITSASGVSITCRTEDADLVARQFLDIALEHNEPVPTINSLLTRD